MTEISNYRHRMSIQVRFSDIDRLNHVNNACYHNYCELGRITYFGEVLTGFINWDRQGFILGRTEIDHLEPVFLNDEVYCYTRIARIGNKSIEVHNLITKKNGGAENACAAVKGILVAMDYAANVSIRVPDPWRQAIEKFEK